MPASVGKIVRIDAMGSISPAKILLLLLVALIVLGPERLPDMARKAGKLFNDFRKVRSGLENEVREVFGDVPAAMASVRSPMAWLNNATAAPNSTTTASAGSQVVAGADLGDGPSMAAPNTAAFGPAPGAPTAPSHPAPAGDYPAPVAGNHPAPPVFGHNVVADDPSLN